MSQVIKGGILKGSIIITCGLYIRRMYCRLCCAHNNHVEPPRVICTEHTVAETGTVESDRRNEEKAVYSAWYLVYTVTGRLPESPRSSGIALSGTVPGTYN
jgi:hypothetical protein